MDASGDAYVAQSQALDAEIAAVIAAWHRDARRLHETEFTDLALRVFAHQLRYNRPYARYCARLGITPDALPGSWRDVPAVPAAAFKESALTTFDPACAALAFTTSGTTEARAGRHYLETSKLYDAACAAAFAHCMLPDGARLRYLNVVPNPSQRPDSSLGYMMGQVSRAFGAGPTGWFLNGDALDFHAFEAALRESERSGQPVCIAATAFALVHAVDRWQARDTTFRLPRLSRVMETGGFKGRSRTVEREELYERVTDALGLTPNAIVAEYGMTELSSQYYDDVLLSGRSPTQSRRKVAPPWLRTRVVGPDGGDLPEGTAGALVHVDLANRSSCIAVSTEDLGVRFESDGGYLVLIGRDADASLRGCSLDAETLLRR